MARRAAPRAESDESPSLTFVASLAGFGRRAIILDAEGECVLALQIPASEASLLVTNYEALLNRTFFVTLTLKAD